MHLQSSGEYEGYYPYLQVYVVVSRNFASIVLALESGVKNGSSEIIYPFNNGHYFNPNILLRLRHGQSYDRS